MAYKKQKSEPEFIRGTVLASILLLLIFIAAGVVFARNPDAVRGAAVRTLSSLGNFSAAAELAGDMDGDEAQAQSLYHVDPVCQIRFRTIQFQTFTCNLGKIFFFHCKRCFI